MHKIQKRHTTLRPWASGVQVKEFIYLCDSAYLLVVFWIKSYTDNNENLIE